MDWWKEIILSGLTISLVMKYLFRGTSKESAKNINGEIELRVSKFYQNQGYLAIGTGLIFMAIVLLYYEQKDMYLVLAFFFFFFFGIGIPFLIYHQNHKLRFNDERIIFQDWRKKTKEISWAEINEIKFDLTGHLNIKGLNKKMTINKYLVGFPEFVKKMDEKVNVIS